MASSGIFEGNFSATLLAPAADINSDPSVTCAPNGQIAS